MILFLRHFFCFVFFMPFALAYFRFNCRKYVPWHLTVIFCSFNVLWVSFWARDHSTLFVSSFILIIQVTTTSTLLFSIKNIRPLNWIGERFLFLAKIRINLFRIHQICKFDLEMRRFGGNDRQKWDWIGKSKRKWKER